MISFKVVGALGKVVFGVNTNNNSDNNNNAEDNDVDDSNVHNELPDAHDGSNSNADSISEETV